jgi:protein TonB
MITFRSNNNGLSPGDRKPTGLETGHLLLQVMMYHNVSQSPGGRRRKAMYADHLRSRRIDPVGLGGAAVIGGAIIAALINVAPHLMIRQPTTFPIVDYPEPPTPPVEKKAEPPKKVVEKQPADRIVVPPPPFTLPHSDPILTHPTDLIDQPPPPLGLGTGEGKAIDPPVAPPPFIAADIDPRYADDFQPPYPGDKLRAEEEGMITVRVQIGTDGRVKAIDPVGKADLSFFDATKRQALKLWRFKPATRGGVPVESSKTMTVRFRIT